MKDLAAVREAIRRFERIAAIQRALTEAYEPARGSVPMAEVIAMIESVVGTNPRPPGIRVEVIEVIKLLWPRVRQTNNAGRAHFNGIKRRGFVKETHRWPTSKAKEVA